MIFRKEKRPGRAGAAIRGACGMLVLCAAGLLLQAPQAKAAAALTPADYVEIYQLYSAYSIALDTGNGPARVATFTPDGTFSSYLSKQVPEKMDILLKRTNAYPQKKIPDARMMHILVNIHVTPTAQGADGTCYALLSSEPAAGHTVLTPGFYTDTLVKTAEGWRFKTRKVVIVGRG